MAIALHHNLFIPRDSAVHRWPTRAKLLSLLAMMFAIALIKHIVLLPWVGFIVFGLYGYARLPLQYLVKRLPYPGIFILATVALLPFISGQTILWQWGWLTLRQEGIESGILIAGRFVSIVVLGFILLGTTPFLEIMRAMRSLKVPALLTDMTLLTYRYLFEIIDQLSTMRQSMRLRGYGSQPQSLTRRVSWLSSLLGSLLIRSYDKSQRVYQAMHLRGYGQNSNPIQSRGHAPPQTTYLTISTLALSLSFIIAEWSLSRS